MATKQYPISIRFVGKKFDTHSIPIYELGEVLLAMQRMINRAYLISISQTGEEDESLRLRTRSIHSKAVRQKLSLQLAGREAGSDVYNLTWFADDIDSQIVDAMLSHVSAGTAAYAKKKVYIGSPENPEEVDLNASALYNEVKALTNRIRSVGNIDAIEIAMQGYDVPIVVDKDTKSYVKELQNLQYLGEPATIGGRILNAHVAVGDAMDVFVHAKGRKVRVKMKSTDFDLIMKVLTVDKNPYFEFHGKPRLKIGHHESEFREFVASSMKVNPSPGTVLAREPAGSGRGRPKGKKLELQEERSPSTGGGGRPGYNSDSDDNLPDPDVHIR